MGHDAVRTAGPQVRLRQDPRNRPRPVGQAPGEGGRRSRSRRGPRPWRSTSRAGWTKSSSRTSSPPPTPTTRRWPGCTSSRRWATESSTGSRPARSRAWLNKLAKVCQCCVQGKDAARPEGKQRCCAVGECCHEHAGRRTVQAARNTLRAALNHAKASDELVSRNVAAYAKVPSPPQAPPQRLSVERRGGQPVPGIGPRRQRPAVRRLRPGPGQRTEKRRGPRAHLAQHRRGQGGTRHRLAAPARRQAADPQEAGQDRGLRRRRHAADAGHLLGRPRAAPDEQDAAREQAGDRWQESDLVFTTRWGTPIEPRNFNRSFDARCAKAGVPRIRVHDTRHTCASLLAALDVHPRVAMRILRHAKIAMTMEVYTQVPDEITRAALKKLGDSLGGLPHAEQDRP